MEGALERSQGLAIHARWSPWNTDGPLLRASECDLYHRLPAVWKC